MLDSSNSIRFQFVSDLHLEFPHSSSYVAPITPVADNLILLGDIGYPRDENYRAFVAEQARQFNHVYVIAGNHEYWGLSYAETNIKIQQICDDFENVTFLNKTRANIPGTNYTLLGCTLWAHTPDEFKLAMRWMIRDYHRISYDHEHQKKITIEDTNTWHAEQVKWLEENIQSVTAEGRELIICTHHAPVLEAALDPKELAEQGDIAKHMSGTDLTHLCQPSVKAWLFGHTHYNCDFFSNKTRIVSNQRGYKDEETGFDNNKTLSIPRI